MYIDKSCSAGALIIKFNILKKKRFCNVILSYSKKALQTHTGIYFCVQYGNNGETRM